MMLLRRAGSALVDGFIKAAVLIVLASFGVISFTPSMLLSFGGIVLPLVVYGAVSVAYETVLLDRFGTTPGKAVFGLWVGDPEGRRLERSTSALRTAAALLYFVPFVGWAFAAFSLFGVLTNGRALHDYVAGSRVAAIPPAGVPRKTLRVAAAASRNDEPAERRRAPRNEGRGTWAYEVIDPMGRRRKGRMEADSREAVLNTLRSPGWSIVSVDRPGGLPTSIYDVVPGLSRFKPTPTIMADFARRLHQLLRSGLTVTQALETLVEGYGDTYLASVCQDLADQVGAGVPLAKAMKSRPEVFTDMVVAYISTAEATGSLVETTARLAKMLEKRSSVDRRIRAVSIYPLLVLGVISVIVTGLLIFVVPNFAKVYTGLGAELPKPTLILLKVAFPSALSIIAVFLSLGFFLALKRRGSFPPSVNIAWERFMWRTPLFGKLLRRLALFRWISVLSGAVASGLRINDAVLLAGRASGSAQMLAVSPALAQTIIAGRPLSAALAEHPDVFGAETRAMILTGEKAGDLESMLDSVARSLDEEIDSIIAGLGAKVEVALLVMLVTVVGTILILLYLPVLSIAQVALNSLNGGSTPTPVPAP